MSDADNPEDLREQIEELKDHSEQDAEEAVERGDMSQAAYHSGQVSGFVHIRELILND